MSTLIDSRRRSHRTLGVWLAYWFVLFVIMHIPGIGPGPFKFNYADKLVHFALFSLLTWMGARYRLERTGGLATRALVLWVAIFAGYAAFDEWSQQFFRRTTSFYDWLADVAGILAATTAFWLWRRKLSEPPGRM